MNTETMYTLGQIVRCVFGDDTPPSLTDLIVVQPATGLAKVMRSEQAKHADEELERLINRLPPDLSDPKGGVKLEDQGPFWLGFYQLAAGEEHAKSHGPAELAQAGQALYGERWQSDLARDLGLSDPRRIRQFMAGERKIPPGIWADVARLLRQRGLAAVALSSKLDR